MNDFGSRESAKLWLTGAVGFYEAASALLEKGSKPGAIFHWPAFYVNLCYAYELSFKGFLAANGWSDDSLKNEIGHDLHKAFLKSRESKFTPHSKEVSEMLDVLGPLHRSHSLRYLTGKAVDLPIENKKVLRLTREHLLAVGNQLGVNRWGFVPSVRFDN